MFPHKPYKTLNLFHLWQNHLHCSIKEGSAVSLLLFFLTASGSWLDPLPWSWPTSFSSWSIKHPCCSAQIVFLSRSWQKMSGWSGHGAIIYPPVSSHLHPQKYIPDWSKWPALFRGCRLLPRAHGGFQVYKRDLYLQPDIQRCQPPQTRHAVIT